MVTQDTEYMQRALRLAARGLYTTDPNPRVGCVIVREDRIVGEGWHRVPGEGHAEVLALAQAGKQARGATVYVTLEPCSHHGKTPPCADALVSAGVARVVAAMQDPNPLVSGAGLQRLRDAGIAVECGLLELQAMRLNPGFVKRMQRGLPWTRLKMAMSLDGRTAMASGESRWITGEAARADVQRLRARSSVVLTGSGTVLHDNPSLNVRLDPSDLGVDAVRQPMRVVLDSRARLTPALKLFSLPGRTLVLAAAEHAVALPCEVVQVETDPHTGKISLQAAMRWLAGQHANEVHVEAGAELGGALLASGLVDELVLYIAPHLMGSAARGLFELPGLECMQDRFQLRFDDVRMVGRDLRVTAAPV